MKGALFVVAAVVLTACSTMYVNPYVEQKRARCAALVEIVEARIEAVDFSEGVLRVYRECVDEFGDK